jgi:RNA polymerase sigma factor (sigma-70 family)
VRELHARFRGALSWEDVEDIVQSALVEKACVIDDRTAEQRRSWFRVVLRNAAIDFIRARDGRSTANDAEGRQRPVIVSLDAAPGDGSHPALATVEGGYDPEHLDRERDRVHAQRVAWRALRRLPAQDRRLIELRHRDGLTNAQMAAELGISVKWLERRWAQAWARFVRAVAHDEPERGCRQVRTLMAGRRPGQAPTARSAIIDAHLIACASCRTLDHLSGDVPARRRGAGQSAAVVDEANRHAGTRQTPTLGRRNLAATTRAAVRHATATEHGRPRPVGRRRTS